MSNDVARPAGRTPTLQDVATLAGVSPATVSRVMNNVRNVDPALHSTVMQAVSDTGYVPNRMARSLVTRRAGSIALVISEAEQRPAVDPFMSRFFSDPFFGRVLGGLLSAIAPGGVHLSMTLTGTDQTRAGVVSSLRQGHLDAVAVISLHPGDPFPGQLAAAGVPAALFGRPNAAVDISYVDLDNVAGGQLAGEHLLARGCRRIATITGSLDMPAGADRLVGFRAALAAAGRAEVPLAEADFTPAGAIAAMRALLADHPDLDGVFIASDVMAQAALSVLAEHGRAVPGDVAVVGFDDSSAALACYPQLTTICQPVEDMAAQMGRVLLAALDSAAGDQRIVRELFTPALVVRGSA